MLSIARFHFQRGAQRVRGGGGGVVFQKRNPRLGVSEESFPPGDSQHPQDAFRGLKAEVNLKRVCVCVGWIMGEVKYQHFTGKKLWGRLLVLSHKYLHNKI